MLIKTCMSKEEGLQLIESLLGKDLTPLELDIFHCAWEDKPYLEVSLATDYTYYYIKQVGAKLWRSLTQVTGERVSKNTLQSSLLRYQERKLPTFESRVNTNAHKNTRRRQEKTLPFPSYQLSS